MQCNALVKIYVLATLPQKLKILTYIIVEKSTRVWNLQSMTEEIFVFLFRDFTSMPIRVPLPPGWCFV